MAKKISDYKNFNDYESQEYLANYYAGGKLTSQKFISGNPLYKMILSLSTFIKIVTGTLFEFVRNINIDKADELLTEWETSVKLPERYPLRDTIEDRREAVKRLISKYPVYNIQGNRSPDVDIYSTMEEYIRIMTGIEVEIEGGAFRSSGNTFPLIFPVTFDLPSYRRNFLFYVKVPVETSTQNNQFPLPFPVQFFDAFITDTTKNLLNKVLDDIIPSFGTWVFEPLT